MSINWQVIRWAHMQLHPRSFVKAVWEVFISVVSWLESEILSVVESSLRAVSQPVSHFFAPYKDWRDLLCFDLSTDAIIRCFLGNLSSVQNDKTIPIDLGLSGSRSEIPQIMLAGAISGTISALLPYPLDIVSFSLFLLYSILPVVNPLSHSDFVAS